MGNIVKKTRKMNEWGVKRYRRYGTLVHYLASRKVRGYKRNEDYFELSGCCLKRCLSPLLTCDKCHMEY